jgi:hypothetical protein
MSSGSINDIAIKLGIDATGVATGMKHATAEALRASRDVEKAESLEREYNIKQQLDDIDNANKARMKSEEAFSKWYAQTLEEEFQVWYQLELRKEKEAETFAVNRQQAAINQANALSHGQWQTQFMPTETFDRRLELDKLQEDLEKRYAIIYAAQDREERLRRAQVLDEKRNIDESKRQFLSDLREREAANERSLADEALYNRRLRAIQLDRKRQEEDVSRQRINNIKAADQQRLRSLEETQLTDAKALIESTTSAYDKHVATLVRLNRHRDAGRITLQQYDASLRALNVQFLRAEASELRVASATNRLNNAFGGVSGAMTQASYAAEDFIQVFSMGGGLNMALMSASNNLSMVVRALAGTSGAMAAIAGFGVPAVLIGVGALVRGLMEEEEQANKTADALRNTADAVDELFDAHDRQYKHQNALDEIRRIETMEGIMAKINQQEKERNDLLEKQERLEAKLAALREKASELSGTGASLANLGNDIAQQIANGNPEASQAEIDALIKEKVSELELVYKSLQEAITSGTEEEILRAAKQYEQVLSQYTFMNGAFSGEFIDAAHERIAALLKEEGAVRAIKDAYTEEAAGQEEISNILKEIEDAEKRRIEIADTIARQQADALKAAQEEYLLKLRMTEAERELYDLRKAQEEFMGPAASRIMRGEGPLQEADQDAAMAFLEGQRDALRKDLEALVPEIIVKAGLEQSAMDAQAKAFDQMLQASAKKPDPQIERTNRLLESIDNAIKNGGRIEVIQ